ncbi:hypothetical protein HDU76_012680 [Blyttiomyces sp. JEL0837]|nr:hypothetical protein HDU76_012680 [Blyttiomyces sp. JEL0837]
MLTSKGARLDHDSLNRRGGHPSPLSQRAQTAPEQPSRNATNNTTTSRTPSRKPSPPSTAKPKPRGSSANAATNTSAAASRSSYSKSDKYLSSVGKIIKEREGSSVLSSAREHRNEILIRHLEAALGDLRQHDGTAGGDQIKSGRVNPAGLGAGLNPRRSLAVGSGGTVAMGSFIDESAWLADQTIHEEESEEHEHEHGEDGDGNLDREKEKSATTLGGGLTRSPTDSQSASIEMMGSGGSLQQGDGRDGVSKEDVNVASRISVSVTPGSTGGGGVESMGMGMGAGRNVRLAPLQRQLGSKSNSFSDLPPLPQPPKVVAGISQKEVSTNKRKSDDRNGVAVVNVSLTDSKRQEQQKGADQGGVRRVERQGSMDFVPVLSRRGSITGGTDSILSKRGSMVGLSALGAGGGGGTNGDHSARPSRRGSLTSIAMPGQPTGAGLRASTTSMVAGTTPTSRSRRNSIGSLGPGGSEPPSMRSSVVQDLMNPDGGAIPPLAVFRSGEHITLRDFFKFVIHKRRISKPMLSNFADVALAALAARKKDGAANDKGDGKGEPDSLAPSRRGSTYGLRMSSSSTGSDNRGSNARRQSSVQNGSSAEARASVASSQNDTGLPPLAIFKTGEHISLKDFFKFVIQKRRMSRHMLTNLADVAIAALAARKKEADFPGGRSAADTFITGLMLDDNGQLVKRYGVSPAFKRLRRVVRIVAIASHFCKFLSRILKNPIQWGWEYDPDANLFKVTSQDGNQKKSQLSAIDFGVMNLFNTQKVFKGWLNDAMRHLFRKPPHLRSESDLMEMQVWCAGMKAFSKYQPHVQKKLLAVGRYERWHSGRLIVKEGHYAMNFYVLLDGEVEVFRIDKEGLEANYQSQLKNRTFAASHRHLADDGITVQDIDEEDEEDSTTEAEKMAEYERAYRVILGTQSSGESFGELAFINDGKRLASVSTKRTTEFLVIARDDFESVMTLAQDTDVREKMHIMKSIPMLKTLSATLGTLAHYCEIKIYPPNALVVCEGDVSEYIYFIHSGTCRLVKAVPFAKIAMSRGTFRLDTITAGTALPDDAQIVTKFLVVQNLYPGDHYYDGNAVKTAKELIMQSGLGNSEARTSVIANLRTKVLRMSKLDFNKFATKATWPYYVDSAVKLMPSQEILSQAYMSKRVWDVYKRKIVEQLILDLKRRRPVTSDQIVWQRSGNDMVPT